MERNNNCCEMLSAFNKTASIWLMVLFLILIHFPALPVSSIPLVLLIVVCISDWPEVKKIFAEYKLPAAIIVSALLVGVLFSYNPEKSVKGVYDFLRGVVIFFPALYLVRKYPEKIQSSLVWISFLCSLIYLSYVAYAVFFVSALWEEQRAFLDECLRHFNIYGTSVALIVFIAMASLLLLQRSSFERCVLVVTTVIGSGVLIYSGSRGSVVSLFISASILIFIRFRKKFVLTISGVTLALLCLWGVVYFNLAGNYLRSWVRGADITSGRMKIYAATLNDVWQHAKFFGFGPNTYKYLDYGQVFNQPLYTPHSVYVEVAFSLGIVGTLLMLAVFFILMRKFIAWRSFSFYPALGLGLAVFLLVRGLVDMKLFDVYFPGALALAFAFMLAGKDQYDPVRKANAETI